jgi:hypothetical protein
MESRARKTAGSTDRTAADGTQHADPKHTIKTHVAARVLLTRIVSAWRAVNQKTTKRMAA